MSDETTIAPARVVGRVLEDVSSLPAGDLRDRGLGEIEFSQDLAVESEAWTLRNMRVA